MGIGQAAHVEDKIGIGRYAVFETEGLDQYAHLGGRLRQQATILQRVKLSNAI